MESAIGEALPLALGIAISPVPIIAAILMLLGPRARGTSVGYLVGWVVGVMVAVTVFTLLSALIPASDPNASEPVAGIVKLVLGLLLLLLAARKWRGGPTRGCEPALPKWMSGIGSLTVVRGAGLGFVLALNPKNLIMSAGAGTAIGSNGLGAASVVVAVAVFTVVASSTIAVPVLGYVVAAERMQTALERLRSWLVDNNATVMTVMLGVIGVTMIGKGIGSF